MALPTSAEKTWLPILEIIDNKGKGYSTNFTGIYSIFIQKLNLSKLEIEAEIEENTFAIKEILKIGRDTLLENGWLNGSATSFEISKKGKALLKFCFSKKISDLSELPFDILLEYMGYDLVKRKKTITINEIEYTTKGWDRKVFKFAEQFNNKVKIAKKEIVQPTLFDSNISVKSNNVKTNKSVKESVKELIISYENQLKKELLERLKKIDPFDFEKIATDIICDVVYGKITPDFRNDVAKYTKGSGDGGIDGIVIKNDKYGSKTYYIQTKRWTSNSIGSPEIDSFFAALSKKNAKDGIFITTSTFSKPALSTIKEFEEMKNITIFPINGEKLVELILENEIGIITERFEMKEIDASFFKAKK